MSLSKEGRDIIMETFRVERNDNCIWVEDLRVNETVHITPDQAEELRTKLSQVLSLVTDDS